MHTTNQLLDEISARNGGVTNYRLSKLLRTHTQTIDHWRKGRSIMSSDFAPRVAALLGWDAAYVMACVEHERVSRSAVRDPLEQTGEVLATWQRIAEKFRPALPVILAALLLPLGALFPEHSQAAASTASAQSELTGLYIMRSRRRRRRTWLERFNGWWRTEFPVHVGAPA